MTTPVNPLFEKLRSVEARYEELNRLLADPEIASDSKRYHKTAKAHADFRDIVAKFHDYKDIERAISETRAMLRDETDAELKAMAEEELASLEQRLAESEAELKV